MISMERKVGRKKQEENREGGREGEREGGGIHGQKANAPFPRIKHLDLFFLSINNTRIATLARSSSIQSVAARTLTWSPDIG